MFKRLPLSAHTSYAELMERLRLGRIGEYPPGSSFVSKTVKGRLYWYVQMPTGGASSRKQVYVGPDSEELRETIARHGEHRADLDDRRRLVAAIIASGAPRPDRTSGEIIQALASAGAFRLRALLVGTVAFQTYAAHLDVCLPVTSLATLDLDVAQDFGVASNLDDTLDRPLLDILRDLDPRFAPVSYAFDASRTTSYSLGERYRLDVLTTNRGAPRDKPSYLPSLKSDAAPLPYMDFLIRDPVQTAVLHGGGVLVNAPAPARYAVHKLIVSRQRKVNPEKGLKDRLQAGQLIQVLAQDDPFALRDAYAEARDRGETWRKLLDEAVSLLPAEARAVLAS
uniref:nucleotidyltransferase family protein n=1 Tax=uncultured Caulobacter sp. TaxID=158749 RepID=UPI0025FCC8E2|nr:GSU2403 family nucleotidyltransferase fold protein [uncultured Caulobacter sp.]